MPRLPAKPPPPVVVDADTPLASAQPTVAPAKPLSTIPISTAEEDIAFAPLLDDDQKAQLALVNATDRTKLRDLSRSIRSCNTQSSDLKKRRDDLTREWLVLIERSGLGAVPCVDSVTRQPLLAYKREDEMLAVDVNDLREFLFEHFKVTMGEEEDLAIIHASDIMGQVLKAPSVDNDAFRKLVENGTINGDVAAAASVITKKSAYVAFQKPTSQRK